MEDQLHKLDKATEKNADKLEAHERECNLHRENTKNALIEIKAQLKKLETWQIGMVCFFGSTTIGALLAIIYILLRSKTQ